MAKGNTWFKKHQAHMKRDAMRTNFGPQGRFTDNKPAPKRVHNAAVAREIALMRQEAKRLRRSLRA